MDQQLFDIVTPCGPNDLEVVQQQVMYTKKNVIGYRNIYIITNLVAEISGCIIVPESVFPFGIKDVAEAHGENTRNGWYLQQMLKMYAGEYIPGILDKWLVIDSDTFFLKPTTFFKNGRPCYAVGREYWLPYFNHMARLHPGLKRFNESISGICHHMMFEKQIVEQLFKMVEEVHEGVPFWKLFFGKVEEKDKKGSGGSEYEIYFNYLLNYHQDRIQIRILRWANVRTFMPDCGLDYISYHWHMREGSKQKSA